MTTIALDPGISTGCAIHTNDDTYITAVILNPKDVWNVLNQHKPTICVFENFASGGLISKDGQATIRLIGAIELACHILHIQTVLQMPQERYGQLAAARLMIKQRGKTPVSHEVDALAHLLTYEYRVQTGLQDKLASKRRNTYGN